MVKSLSVILITEKSSWIDKRWLKVYFEILTFLVTFIESLSERFIKLKSLSFSKFFILWRLIWFSNEQLLIKFSQPINESALNWLYEMFSKIWLACWSSSVFESWEQFSKLYYGPFCSLYCTDLYAEVISPKALLKTSLHTRWLIIIYALYSSKESFCVICNWLMTASSILLDSKSYS